LLLRVKKVEPSFNPPATIAETPMACWDLFSRNIEISALLNTGMNSRFRKGYKPSRVSFVTSSEKLIHTVNQQRLLNKCSSFGIRQLVLNTSRLEEWEQLSKISR
jgi:hypothetical protein